jgi:DNA-binding NarL/FixJ family response regulator
MPRPIRILIVEDHNVVREGLKILINSDPGFTVAGEAENGRDAVQIISELRPDVVLMDLAMPNGGGLEATRQICAMAQAPKVLVLSAYQEENLVLGAMEAGAAGFITKHSAAVELLVAIREVFSDRQYCSPHLVRRMQKRVQSRFVNGTGAEAPRLTPREQEVLVLVSSGFSNKQVAAQLGVSIKTIEKHRQHLMDKLNIHEVASLTRYALERGFIPAAAAGSEAVGAIGQRMP